MLWYICFFLYQGCNNIEVDVVLNDTTATLVAGSYVDSNCAIGVIIGIFLKYLHSVIINLLGTGANAAYYEPLENIKWFVEKHPETQGHKKVGVHI